MHVLYIVLPAAAAETCAPRLPGCWWAGTRVRARLSQNTRMAKEVHVQSGIGVFGFGTALAITISWSLWHSVLWATIHGIFSWFYVFYYLFMPR